MAVKAAAALRARNWSTSLASRKEVTRQFAFSLKPTLALRRCTRGMKSHVQAETKLI